MALHIRICRMLDGVIKDHHEKYFTTWDWHAEYMWTDGNHGCDCNRARFFGEIEDVGCGENAYTIRVLEDGVEVYKEDGFPEDPECPASKPTKPTAP